jgi:hypothetical protein
VKSQISFFSGKTPEAHSPLARFSALRAKQSRLETRDFASEEKICLFIY